MIDSMAQSDACKMERTKEAKLPRRDFILLPVIGLLTICLIAVFFESIAWLLFPSSRTLGEDCMMFNDSSTGTGPRGIPNAVCWEKIPEGERTRYRFNSSGYRSEVEFRPKSAGTYRIVLVGSSFPFGMRVPAEKTFAMLLPAELSQRTGRNVELYNEAMAGFGGYPNIVERRFKDVLAANPDLILWVLTPWDLQKAATNWPFHEEPANRAVKESWVVKSIRKRSGGVLDLTIFRLDRIRVVLMFEHYLYGSRSQFVKSSLAQGDDDAGFLKAEPSAEWKKRLLQFDSNDAEIEGRVKAAGVPLVVVLVPNRPQAAMISMGEWPAGYNPYKLDDELRSIVTNHGGIYIDILPEYRNIPNPEQHYFPVEGHLDADGHGIVSEILARELTSGAIPALKVAAQPQVAQEQGR